jgi:hypothetical protein
MLRKLADDEQRSDAQVDLVPKGCADAIGAALRRALPSGSDRLPEELIHLIDELERRERRGGAQAAMS